MQAAADSMINGNSRQHWPYVTKDDPVETLAMPLGETEDAVLATVRRGLALGTRQAESVCDHFKPSDNRIPIDRRHFVFLRHPRLLHRQFVKITLTTGHSPSTPWRGSTTIRHAVIETERHTSR